VYEAPGVQPVFFKKEHAIGYAQNRAGFSLRRNSHSQFEKVLLSVQFRSTRQTENCDVGNNARPAISCNGLRKPAGAYCQIYNSYINKLAGLPRRER
jgi:hypothetical protein